MSVGERKGNIYIEDFNLFSNDKNQWTPFAEFIVPPSEWFVFRGDKPVNIFVPAKYTVNHGGTGEETFEVDARIVDSSALTDDQTVYTSKGDSVSVSYATNEVTINHNVNEDVDIYYLFGNGKMQVKYVPPFAQGSLKKNVMEKSFLSIHAINQFDSKSQLYLNKSALVPEKHKIQIWANAPVDIEFPPNFEIGGIMLPYKARPNSEIPEGTEQEIINGLTN